MKGTWMRIDVNYVDDPKFTAYMALSETKAKRRDNRLRFLDLVRAWTMSDHGVIHLDEPGERFLLEEAVGLSGKKLEAWLALLARCGLVDKDAYEGLRQVASERSMRESAKRDRRKEASDAANEAKRARRG